MMDVSVLASFYECLRICRLRYSFFVALPPFSTCFEERACRGSHGDGLGSFAGLSAGRVTSSEDAHMLLNSIDGLARLLGELGLAWDTRLAPGKCPRRPVTSLPSRWRCRSHWGFVH